MFALHRNLIKLTNKTISIRNFSAQDNIQDKIFVSNQ
jgi:hypothetical protein